MSNFRFEIAITKLKGRVWTQAAAAACTSRRCTRRHAQGEREKQTREHGVARDSPSSDVASASRDTSPARARARRIEASEEKIPDKNSEVEQNRELLSKEYLQLLSTYCFVIMLRLEVLCYVQVGTKDLTVIGLSD